MEILAALEDMSLPGSYVAMLRLTLAATLGAGIGWERERHGRAAGLRTHLLLCVGCALIMLISLQIPRLFLALGSESTVRIDPSRVASQVLSGLGFLGAGAIIVLGQHIRGLTTAACIWVTAAIGLAVGAGFLALALFTWGVVIVALLVVGRLERRMARKDQYMGLTLVFPRPGERIGSIQELLGRHGMRVVEYTVDRRGQVAEYNLQVLYSRTPDFEQVSTDLANGLAEDGVQEVSWGIATIPT